MFLHLVRICLFSLFCLALPEAVHPAHHRKELRALAPGKPGFKLVLPAESGVVFSNTLSAEVAAKNQILLNGSGVAAGDVDGDGWCDLYFCGLEGPNRLFKNEGNWRFTDITAQSDVACPDQFSSAAALADLDGDGDLDLLVNGIGKGTRLFLNNGLGRFSENVSAGLVRRFGSTSMALADIDNDGDLDLYVANYRTTTIRSTGLAILHAAGRMMAKGEEPGSIEFTTDGKVVEHGEMDFLYINTGAGRFSQRPWSALNFTLEDGTGIKPPPRDWGLSVIFRDLNGDHAPDLYVCNDFHSPDRIWLNDGQGHFRSLPELALRSTATFSMALDVADVNRDGFDDILVADMLEPAHSVRLAQSTGLGEVSLPGTPLEQRLQVERNTLHINRGDGTYADLSYFADLEASGWSWSLAFLDVDLDGYEDILVTTGNMFNTQSLDANEEINRRGPYSMETIWKKLLMYPPLLEPNLAFRNNGDLTFTESGLEWGFSQMGVSHGMCLADLDNDGDQDVILNNLNAPAGVYRNEASAPRVAVRLRGAPANTHGIGAKVTLLGGAVPRQSQEIIAGGRYLSSDEPMRVFAAGTGEMRLEVVWRSGRKTVVDRVLPNHQYTIFEQEDSSP